MKSMTLGLILDSPFLPKPTVELLQWLEDNPNIKLKKFFLYKDNDKRNFISKNLWSLIIRFEKLF